MEEPAPGKDLPRRGEEDEPIEDEPPGAVLSEIRPGRLHAIWGLVNLSTLLFLGAAAALEAPGPDAQPLPFRILRVTAPVSALIGLLVTGFAVLTGPRGTGPRGRGPGRIGLWALALHLLTLLLWLALRGR